MKRNFDQIDAPIDGSCLPRDMYGLILSFVPYEGSNWLNCRLVNKLFLGISKRVQDPSLSTHKSYPCIPNNYAIVWASQRGRAELVKELLQDTRIDPTASYNAALRAACKYGRTEVVKILLQDPRIDPEKSEPDVVKFGCWYGGPFCSPKTAWDEAISGNAYKTAHTGVTIELLKDARLVEKYGIDVITLDFVERGYWKLIPALLGHPLQKDECREGFLWTAIRIGNHPMVREILKFGKCSDFFVPLKMVMKSGFLDIFRELLKYAPMGLILNSLRTAARHGRLDMVIEGLDHCQKLLESSYDPRDLFFEAKNRRRIDIAIYVYKRFPTWHFEHPRYCADIPELFRVMIARWDLYHLEDEGPDLARYMAYCGYTESLQILLQHPRLDVALKVMIEIAITDSQ
jgi:ankyrin repeat protein